MGYTQCIFGVPSDRADEATVLAAVRACMIDLVSQGLRIPRTYVLIDSEARARRTGLRLFMIGVREPGNRVLARTPIFEFLIYKKLPMVVLLHDDRRGIFLFERYDPEAEPPMVRLMSDGAYLGGSGLRHVTIDYPQKGFSNEALRALHEKPPEELTPREARAIMEWKGAVWIGLRQFFPRWRASYLDLLYCKNAWRVFHPEKREEPPRKFKKPAEWRNFVAWWPEDEDWDAAGLEPRWD
ncbi:MAG TPA: hypothetical protein VIK91_26565 [Nannocystis sp.]